MASSKSTTDDLLGESWVELGAPSVGGSSQGTSGGTPGSATPLIAEEYLRLLREAQRESNQSSARVSLAGSRKGSPRSSPKSPPNSPVQGTPLMMEWQSYYMNSEKNEDNDIYNNWIQDWSSRPDQIPPKNWSFRHPKRDVMSLRHARVGDTNVFSRKGFYTLVLTNFISLVLGTGVGLWLSKYGFFVPSVKVP